MDLPNRKQNRLNNFDYGKNGAYFITICTKNRKHIFEIEPSPVRNDLCVVPEKNCVSCGTTRRSFPTNYPEKHVHKTTCLQNQIIHKWIKETENKFPNIKIDKYVIMPDHIHLIVAIFNGILDSDAERHIGRSLPDVIRFFKTMTTNEYMHCVKNQLLPKFDKNYGKNHITII